MTHKSFDEFPGLWDGFAKQLKDQIVKELTSRTLELAEFGQTKFSKIYENTGFSYWWFRTGAGSYWKTQLDEVFFENRYYDTIKQLHQFYNLDVLAAPGMDNTNCKDPAELYRMAVEPLLDSRKQELMADFAKMAKELEDPLPYMLKLPVDGQETALMLGFRERCQKRNWDGMEGYTYSFNGRTYKDVQAFTTATIERLSPNVSIAKDTFGDMVLRRYTEIPTFDSSDREWDSAEIEYLLFDGKDIHLIVMRGGYRIAQLTFYEKLLTADARMKPIVEKLGWPVDNITWN